jgi:hypothetical protein
MMEYRKTKERLEQQARLRRENLKANKKQEMTKEEFNEKWTLPAYLRRGVKMDNPISGATKALLTNMTEPSGVRIELLEYPPESLQKKAIDGWK